MHRIRCIEYNASNTMQGIQCIEYISQNIFHIIKCKEYNAQNIHIAIAARRNLAIFQFLFSLPHPGVIAGKESKLQYQEWSWIQVLPYTLQSKHYFHQCYFHFKKQLYKQFSQLYSKPSVSMFLFQGEGHDCGGQIPSNPEKLQQWASLFFHSAI